MNGDFYIWSNLHSLSETKAIERLKYAFMMPTRAARFARVECQPEQVSPASEWTHPGQTDSFDLLDGGPSGGACGKSSKWRPAVGKFTLESKSPAKAA
jgi:hypothetical protein